MKQPEAFKRVVVQEDPAQDEAAVQHIDRTNGADQVTVTINPTLVDEEGAKGYRIRAAIAGTLEGFARYNRRVNQRFGSIDADQLLFDQSYERAVAELDELVHLAPRGNPTPAQAKKLLSSWLEDEALASALTPLLKGGDDGQPESQLESAGAAGRPDGTSTQGGGRRPRRGSS